MLHNIYYNHAPSGHAELGFRCACPLSPLSVKQVQGKHILYMSVQELGLNKGWAKTAHVERVYAGIVCA